MGIGSDALRQQHPSLITCDISGYGQDGPYRELKAYDLLVQAESGLAFLTGTPDSPARVGVSVCDIGAGMYAYQAILQALYARQRGGQGRGIQISLFHSVADWMNVPYLQHRYGGRAVARLGLQHPTVAPYGLYPCRDGGGVLISAQNEREWRRLCETVLQRPELADDSRFATNPDRAEHRAELDAAIDAVFSALPRAEIVARLDAAKIACGRLSSLDDLDQHPQKPLHHGSDQRRGSGAVGAPARRRARCA